MSPKIPKTPTYISGRGHVLKLDGSIVEPEKRTWLEVAKGDLVGGRRESSVGRAQPYLMEADGHAMLVIGERPEIHAKWIVSYEGPWT